MDQNPYQSPETVPEDPQSSFRWRSIPAAACVVVGLTCAVIAGIAITAQATLHPADAVLALMFASGATLLFAAAALFWFRRWRLALTAVAGWVVVFVGGLAAAWAVGL